MSAPVAASVCNESCECRRMRPSNLCDAMLAEFSWCGSHDRKPRNRTQRVLRATQDSAKTRHKPPPAENATPRGTRRRAKQLPRGSISRLAHRRRGRRHRRGKREKWNLHKSYEAATAADGANNSRSCRTTELRVGASSSFNRRSQACKIRRFCSSLR